MASIPVEKSMTMKRVSDSLRLKALRSAPLKAWIALSREDSRIIAVGQTFTEADRAAKQAGETNYVLTKTPDAWVPRAFRTI